MFVTQEVSGIVNWETSVIGDGVFYADQPMNSRLERTARNPSFPATRNSKSISSSVYRKLHGAVVKTGEFRACTRAEKVSRKS